MSGINRRDFMALSAGVSALAAGAALAQQSGLAGGSGLIGIWLTFTYLWLPFMILPIYAGLERIPDSLFHASSDLGASPATTFRKVVLPMAFPSVVAGSIFTFSLTLGDYITPRLVSSSQFIGNVIYDNLGVAGNLPFAAAMANIPDPQP